MAKSRPPSSARARKQRVEQLRNRTQGQSSVTLTGHRCNRTAWRHRTSPESPRSNHSKFIDVGFVTPTRGPARIPFSFQDLTAARGARAHSGESSRRRIRRSLEDLRKHCRRRCVVRLSSAPSAIACVRDAQPISGRQRAYVSAWTERRRRRAACGGKEFGPQPDEAARRRKRGGLVDDAADFERTEHRADIDAYRQTVALDAQNVAAWINWPAPARSRQQARGGSGVPPRGRAVRSGFGADVHLGVLSRIWTYAAALEAYQSRQRRPCARRRPLQPRAAVRSARQPQHAIRHLVNTVACSTARRADHGVVGRQSGYAYPNGAAASTGKDADDEDAAVLRSISRPSSQQHVLSHAEREDPGRLERAGSGAVQADAQSAAGITHQKRSRTRRRREYFLGSRARSGEARRSCSRPRRTCA